MLMLHHNTEQFVHVSVEKVIVSWEHETMLHETQSAFGHTVNMRIVFYAILFVSCFVMLRLWTETCTHFLCSEVT